MKIIIIINKNEIIMSIIRKWKPMKIIINVSINVIYQ